MIEPARSVEYVTCEDVEKIHDGVIARAGGDAGLLSRPALESSVAQPKANFFGYQRHRTIEAKAAAYCYFIICNHPFVDGNKRTGLVTAIHFLRLNGRTGAFDTDDDTLIETVRLVAAGSMSLVELKQFFERSVEK